LFGVNAHLLGPHGIEALLDVDPDGFVAGGRLFLGIGHSLQAEIGLVGTFGTIDDAIPTTRESATGIEIEFEDARGHPTHNGNHVPGDDHLVALVLAYPG